MIRLQSLVLILFFAAALARADAPTYGNLKVKYDVINVYSGAGANSKIEGTAEEGDQFELRGDKLYNGFYKIQYGKKVAFVMAGQVVLKDEKPESTKVPTAKPSAVPTKNATPVILGEHEKDDDDEDHDRKTPTKVPTERPTEKPTAEPTKAPTEKPTAVPTKAPTEKPTAVPTKVPTEKPTAVPTKEPTEKPTASPTKVPTAKPTAVPAKTATPEAPSVGRGKRKPKKETSTTSSGGGYGQVILQTGGAIVSSLPPRDKGQLPQAWLYMPLGGGKHPGNVRPAFKPDASVSDDRYIESSAFFGLGAELRMPAHWLRFSGDWTYFTHRTKAAEQNKLSPKVGLPAPSSVVFPDSDVYYQMNTHAFRFGTKLSLPHPYVEPWINGTLGAYVWEAEYLDGTREWTYGGDQGLAFGATAGLGVDFHLPMRSTVFTITPFLEWGAPTVYPEIKNIADIGQDWKDKHGTLLASESRIGLQLAIGY